MSLCTFLAMILLEDENLDHPYWKEIVILSWGLVMTVYICNVENKMKNTLLKIGDHWCLIFS